MYDYWKDAPEWATLVVKSGYGAEEFYLETKEKGMSGHIRGVSEGGMGLTIASKFHDWYDAHHRDSKVVSRRPEEGVEETLPRLLTIEEMELLDDLGMLDYALEEGIATPEHIVDVETGLSVTVYNSETGDIIYNFCEDEGEDVFHVEHFANVMADAYKHLGFQNTMVVSFDLDDTTRMIRFDPKEM